MYGRGSRSARVDRSWPILMNVGPIFSRSAASCSASWLSSGVATGSGATTSSSPAFLTSSERPYFMKSAAMSR